jgi:glucokinase
MQTFMNILGFDVGGTKISAVLGDEKGKIKATIRRPTIKHLGKNRLRDQLFEIGDQLVKENNIRKLDGVGIIFAGLVDRSKGMIITSPNILGLDNFMIVAALKDHYKTQVVLENDATGATIAEKLFGSGRNSDNFLYLTLSTGIGGGAFVNGKLMRGQHGLAGEFGHMVIMSNGPTCGCGRKGCLEAIASGKSISRRVSESITAVRDSEILSKIVPRDLSAEKIFDAMRKGDMLSRLIVEETIYYLSIGVVNLACAFDPEILIIGGGVSLAGNDLFKPLRDAVREEFKSMARPLKIVQGLKNGGDLAAVAVVLYNYVDNKLN